MIGHICESVLCEILVLVVIPKFVSLIAPVIMFYRLEGGSISVVLGARDDAHTLSCILAVTRERYYFCTTWGARRASLRLDLITLALSDVFTFATKVGVG